MAANDDEELDLEHVEKEKKVVRPIRKITVKEHDTPKSKTEEIIELAQTVLDNVTEENTYKDIAFQLKTKLDSTYSSTWHVIVGTHFGGNVTNDEETLVNFTIDKISFLVLRSGPPERPAPTNEADAASG